MAELAPVPVKQLCQLAQEILADLRGLRADLRARGSARAKQVPPKLEDAGRYERLFLQLEENFSGLSLTFESWEVEEAAKSDLGLAEALAECGLKDAAAIGYAFRKLKDREIGRYMLLRDDRGWRLERTGTGRT